MLKNINKGKERGENRKEGEGKKEIERERKTTKNKPSLRNPRRRTRAASKIKIPGFECILLPINICLFSLLSFCVLFCFPRSPIPQYFASEIQSPFPLFSLVLYIRIKNMCLLAVLHRAHRFYFTLLELSFLIQ